MEITCKRLTEVDRKDVIALMNDPRVRRHMPLAKEPFGDAAYEAFVAAKERIWAEHGYGPWAFVVDGRFAGWGGIQPEQGEADLGLVLHPDYWGLGRRLYDEILRFAFEERGLESVTVLLPPTRTRLRGLARLGFEADGEVQVGGERFLRFRLLRR